MEEHAYSMGEIIFGLIGIGLTIAFGAWAGVVKKTADSVDANFKNAISEIKLLREEIHKDRLISEKRFARLEAKVGIDPYNEDH